MSVQPPHTRTHTHTHRRLSSKKRKKLEANRLSGSDATLSDGGSARSPNDSAYGSCHSVSSTTSTPPGHDRTRCVCVCACAYVCVSNHVGMNSCVVQ